MTPKILVCTVESWNSKIGANTFSTLLAEYPSENLANVYIREEIPDSNRCSRYFQISEQKIIKSLLRRHISTGREVIPSQEQTKEDLCNLTQSRQLYNKNRAKRSYLKLFARELIWKAGRWKSQELTDFIQSFQPDIVLFGMEGYIHFNRICRYIVQKTKAKAIGYFWDDNFTYKQMSKNPGFTLLRFFQRRSLKKTAKLCSAFWAITDQTKKEADAVFGIQCRVLTKPIDFSANETWKPYSVNDPIRMLYTGNLLIGRFSVIQAVSRALEQINRDKTRILLDVYSGSYIAPEELSQLSPYVHMKGVISQEQVLQLQKQADILLFVEALTGPYSKKARLSFSTKITDYLHSGKCILAIGAADTAPMDYLRRENAAICASSEPELLDALTQITSDPSLLYQRAQSAFSCGLRNHHRDKINAILTQTICSLKE